MRAEVELLTREISNKVDHTETRIASLPAGSMVGNKDFMDLSEHFLYKLRLELISENVI